MHSVPNTKKKKFMGFYSPDWLFVIHKYFSIFGLLWTKSTNHQYFEAISQASGTWSKVQNKQSMNRSLFQPQTKVKKTTTLWGYVYTRKLKCSELVIYLYIGMYLVVVFGSIVHKKTFHSISLLYTYVSHPTYKSLCQWPS